MITREAFDKECAQLREMLEPRRRRYGLVFAGGVFLAAICMIGVLFMPPAYRGITASDRFSFEFFLCLCAVLLVLLPLYRYRGGARPDQALQWLVHARLFGLFGPFRFVPEGGAPMAAIRRGLLFPASARVMTEGAVTGVMNEVHVSLCQISATAQGRYFHGIVVVCALSGTRTKLRLPFQGRTLVMPEASALQDTLRARHGSVRTMDLPAPLISMPEIVTTVPEEATPMLTESWLAQHERFTAQADTLGAWKKAADTRLIETLNRVYDWVQEKIAARVGKPPLPAEVAYDKALRAQARTETGGSVKPLLRGGGLRA